ARYALQLGSDCPFFIYNKALFATGRGEQFSPVNLDLSAYQILLVCPPVTVATRWAFQDVPVKAAPFDLRTIDQLPLAEWRQTLSNDFEKSVFARYTELAEIKDLLYRQGALYASLSGSGSVLYGIFPQEARPELQGNFKVWKG